MLGPTAANPLLSELFTDAEIGRHLSAEAEIEAMIRFEAALAKVEAAEGVIPAEAGSVLAEALSGIAIDPADLIAPTAAAGVVVPGLVKALRSAVGEPWGPCVHWGATSQDVVDTGLVLRLREMLSVFEDRLAALCQITRSQAEKHADLPMAARTRSQIATPTSFGLRIAGWAAPLERMQERLAQMKPRLLMLQFGGASGNLSVLGDKAVPVMHALARELDLVCPTKPWHAERDGFVELANWLAMLSGLLGRIGGDLMIMGRSEIAEAKAGPGGGSSTMPHKSNPVLAEALVSMARAQVGHQTAVQAALLHQEERDGTAWSVEWLSLPPMLSMTGAGLAHAQVLMESLTANPEAMTATMNIAGGAIHAERIAFDLTQWMPLHKAQALVKEVSKGLNGRDIFEAVEAACQARGLAVALDRKPEVGKSGEFARHRPGD